MKVESERILRFELRWFDYCSVLENGTNEAVGVQEPRPPDIRDRMREALTASQSEAATVHNADGPGELTVNECLAGEAVLDEAWRADASKWKLRLSPFLSRIGPRATDSFSKVVAAGYQPDTLALDFDRVAKRDVLSNDEEFLRSEIDEISRLLRASVQTLEALANRKRQLDEWLWEKRLRYPEDVPGASQLEVQVLLFKDLAVGEQAELDRLRRHLHRRREPLLGSHLVRLSRRVHQVTGSYHDEELAAVVNELWQTLGCSQQTSAANLRLRRARSLSGRQRSQTQ
jgi:hypothetical protein